ncbi:MAG: endo alpha-1,4 polygalactosaminidase [Actinobacteria bacterium]|nr:endo alpha-1,4 polygalactosaminidase [Actinomycetota bacterium]
MSLLLAGCSTTSVMMPPAGARVDYQLGGAYKPHNGVGMVVRDHSAVPAKQVYSICYINSFQTQPTERAEWSDTLLLRDASGALVIDPNWPDEVLLDTRTSASRTAIADTVAPWITQCATKKFNAVEFDNLDSYTRSDLLSLDDNVALARTLVERAHAAGLAVAQKNAPGDAARFKSDAGFDFAIAEQCATFDECAAYTDVYGPLVINVEYTDGLTAPFAELCRDPQTPTSTVLRDRALVTPDEPGYAYDTCH